MGFVETQTIGKVRNRVSHSVVLVLLWFLTTARPSWVCGGWNDVNSRPQFFGKFNKIHTFSEWLCFDAHYCNILVWILVWKKKSCYTCIQNEMTQNNWSGWKWESLLQESLVWSAWTRLPKPLFYLATPSACMVHFQELSQMTLKTSSNHCKSLCKRLSCKDISVSAASFYRLFSRGLPTDDWINSPVGSDWDTVLRTLIKTFKLTNWTKHWRSCLGESLHPFKIPTWRAHVSAVLQSNN